jgi:cobalt/nickel transport protein
MTLWQRNVLLFLAAVALAVLPLAFLQGAQWSGTDTLGMDAVRAIRPDFEPWFESLYSPAALERYFFGLQALLGTLLLSWGFGWLVGRYRVGTGSAGREPAIAAGIGVAAIILAVALFFVETEFGELQGFISGVQGVCLGTLGFLPGYSLGRRTFQAATLPPVRQAGG